MGDSAVDLATVLGQQIGELYRQRFIAEASDIVTNIITEKFELIPKNYSYVAPGLGPEYKGRIAFILNHLDSAEATLHGKEQDGFKLTGAEREVAVGLSMVIDHIETLAALL